MKTLSICIPTYNRVELLKISINSILNAITFADCNIEIIISDNCSTDNTQTYCLNLVEKYSFIHYYRNLENVIELNFYIAVEKAKTDYVWLFSDDDVLNLNSIKLVYDAILSGNNLIISNYDIYDNSLTVLKKKNYFNISNNIIYKNKNNLLIDYNLKLGFISCVIFERNNFLKMPIEIFDEYRPYGFPFVYGLYSNLNENLNCIIFAESLLVQRGADNPADINWWYKCFVEGSSKIFNELFIFGYSNKAIKKAKKNVFKKYVISDLIWRKTNDIQTIKAVTYIYKYYKIFPIQLLYAVLITITPNFVFKDIIKLKHKILK